MDQYNSSQFQTRTESYQHNAYKSVQSWKKPKIIAPQLVAQSSENKIISQLKKASQGKIGTFDVELKNATAYTDTGHATKHQVDDTSFGFKDVIDIINPLQQLPIVGVAYRNFTGDKLHPMSHIIGGALYGGPVGAVAGTVNAISQVQTGRDIGDHALEFVGLGHNNAKYQTTNNLNDIAHKLENQAPLEELPGSAFSLANTAEPYKAKEAYKHYAVAEGRTAGHMTAKKNWSASNKAQNAPSIDDLGQLPPRQDLTSLKLSAMPPRKEA